MKLARFGAVGRETPGVIIDEAEGVLDARPVTSDYDARLLRRRAGSRRLRDAALAGELPRLDTTNLRVGAPVHRPGKIICIGLNYRNHAIEAGMEIPSEPVIFMKAPNTIVGPNDDVHIPRPIAEDRLGSRARGRDQHAP